MQVQMDYQIHNILDENLLLLINNLNEGKVKYQQKDLYNIIKQQILLENDDKIDNLISILQESFKEYVSQNFRKAELMINVLDLSKVAHQIKESENAVMVFGSTGTGKSTFIHYLAGSIITQMRNTDGLLHWQTSKPKYPSLERVVSRADAKSETKYVIPIFINTKDQEDNEFGDEDEYIICDTPGYNDTDGNESEIANLTGITNCIQKVNSIKPIVLISQKQIGDRGQGIKSLAKMIKSMVKPSQNFSQIIDKFLFVFSKFNNKEDKRSLPINLQNIYKCLNSEEKKDQEFVSVLRTMINQTKNKEIVFFDQQIQGYQFLEQNIKNRCSIQMPKEVFTCFLTTEAGQAITLQLNSDCKRIQTALEKQNYLLVYRKLEQLYLLKGMIQDLRVLKHQWEQNVDIIDKFICGQIETVDKFITSVINLKQIDEEYVREFLQFKKSLHEIKILSDFLPQTENLLNSLVESIPKVIQKIMENAEGEQISFQKNDFGGFYQKLIVFSSVLDDNKYIVSFIQIVMKKIFQKISEASSHFSQQNFLEFYNGIQEIIYFIDQCQFLAQNSQEIYACIDTALENPIKLMQQNKQLILEQINNFSFRNIEQIKTDVSNYQENINNIVLQFQKSKLRYQDFSDKIQDFEKEFKDEISNQYSQQEEKIKAAMSEDSKEIQSMKQKVFKLSVISKLFSGLENNFIKLMNYVNKSVMKITGKVNQIVQELSSVQQDKCLEIHFHNLDEILEEFTDCSWITQFDEDLEYETSKEKIFRSIRRFANMILGKLEQIEISFDDTEEFGKIAEYNEKIRKLKPYSNKDNKLQQILEEYDKDIERRFNLYFEKIKNLISAQSIDYFDSDKSNKFLGKCIKNRILKEKAQDLHEKLKEFIKNQCKVKEQSIGNSFLQLKAKFEKQNLTKDDKQLIIENSNNIYSMFVEMQQIEKYNSIKQILEQSRNQFLLETQQNILKGLFLNIKQNIDEQSHVSQKWIFILQKLKHFDEFDGKSYNLTSLLEECYSKNKLNVNELKKGFEKHTNNQSVIHMHKTLQQLQEAGGENNENKDQQLIFQELKTDIELEMKKMSTSIYQTTQNLKQMVTYSPIQKEFRTQIQNSNDLIRKCQQLDEYINTFKDFINVIQINNSLQISNQNIKALASLGPNKVEQNFRYSNYKESNDQYKFLEELFKVLKQYFPIDDEFEKLSNCRINCFQGLQQKFENLKLDSVKDERLNLQLISSRLDQVGDDLHNCFSKTLQELYKQKLMEKLDSVREKPLKTQEEMIKSVQQFFAYIPLEMKDSLNDYIKEIKNIDRIQKDIQQCFKTKNYSQLRQLKEDISKSDEFEQFNSQLNEFFQKEVEQTAKQIISSVKQNEYNSFVKNLSNLMKIAVEGPPDYFYISNEKIQEIFELFLSQFKQAENVVNNIFNKKENKYDQKFDLDRYNQLSQNLLNFKTKISDKELEFLQSQSHFFVFQKMQTLNEQVIKNMKQTVKQLENLQEDFQNSRSDFLFIYNLRFFDNDVFSKIIDLLNQKYNKLSQNMKEIIIKDQTKFNIEKDFEFYYEQFSLGLRKIQNIQKIFNDCDVNSNQINSNRIQDDLIYKLNSINKEMKTSLKYELEQDIFLSTVTKNINNIFLNAKYLNQYFSADLLKNELNSNQVQQQTLEKIRSLLKNPYKYQKQPNVETIAKYLSDLYQVTQNYIYMEKISSECEQNINNTLQEFSDMKGSLEKLQIILKAHQYGKQIIKNHPVFKGFQISQTNQRIQRFTIEDVIEQTTGYNDKTKKNDLQKNQLAEYFKKFETTQNKYLAKYLTVFEKIDFISLQKQIYESAKYIKFQETGQLEQTSLGYVPDLLAGIFTCWTCLNSKYYFESQSQSYDNPQSFLLKPHPAQVVAIFRLLGIGYSINYRDVQPNCLAQVLTGEGKSVILAALACFYSICGFSVKCACYSNQLSTLDYSEFLPVFEKLQIQQYITYGTFNQVCEEILNQHGDIRQQVSNFIQYEKVENAVNTINQRKQILLIDEVDIFFKKEFFGNNYEIVSSLQDTTIENLIDYIWKSKNSSNFGYQLITQSTEFINCIAKYSKWSEIIEEQTKAMVYDFKNYNNLIKENYKIQNDKIYYKNQDQYLDNISFGYRTLYTYFQENEDHKISSESLRKQKILKISSGSFSYSQLPNKFWIIKGVTGTLRTLSKGQQELIQNNYQINQYTLIPSVYGSSKFQFNKEKDVKVVSKEEYFNVITDEISKRIMGRDNQKRAVLVFFTSKEALLEYYKCNQFQGLKSSAQIMTEDNSLDERKKIIKDATYSGAITLLTKIFGRGIDFQVNDTIIFQNYGIHVIQTFFSDDKSEETQTKGRTARQGEEGSYSMVLNQDSLQAFIKTDEDKVKIEKRDEMYAIFDKNREINFESEFQSNLEYNQKTSLILHQKSETFLKLLKEKKLSEVKKYLLQLNQGPKDTRPSKTLIAMDATGSMSSLITQTKNIVQTTFEQSRVILKEKGYDPDCFQVMFCIFRSYSSRWEEIFQSSSWENNPEKLRQFLQTITAKGGTNPGESVEVGLWWPTSDQPAHLQSEAQQKRNAFGQAYWDSTPLKGIEYYVPESEKLKSGNVPVNAFYLHNRAKTTFEHISKLTNGEFGYLDINSSQSQNKLTSTFVEQILKDIGKQDGRSNELIMAYKAKYS